MVSISGQATSSKPQNDLFDDIPEELKALQQFVNWRLEFDAKDKLTKVPYIAGTTRHASSTNPETWRSYEEAVRAYREHSDGFYNGIGIVMTKRGRIVGGDLDHCIDPVSGEIMPWALPIIARFKNTYWEKSPSGLGLRFFVKGVLPAHGRKKGAIEVYDDKRFLTLTGNRLDGTPEMIAEGYEQELLAFYAEVFGNQNGKARATGGHAESGTDTAHANGHDPSGGQGFTGSDEELIAAAKRAKNGEQFARLWGGDTTGYPSHSEADQALCNMLAFWCGNDPARIDRLFRQSGLYREKKWDEVHYADGRTYGEGTIATALAGAREFYTSRKKGSLLDFNHTDLGNGERLVARHGENLRFCNPWKKWLRWDGQRWKLDATQGVTRLARETLRALYAEAAELAQRAASEEEEDEAVRVLSFARKSEAEPRVKAMATFAQIDCPILPQALDADPWLLNVSNGTLDLRTGKLRPHQREDLLTKLVPVVYDQAAPCSTWEAFLAYILPKQQDVIAFLQRAIGYSLTGDTSEQCLFLLHGTGANGKSTFLEIARALLGEYAEQAEFSSFLHKDRDTVRNDLAKLRGARFVSAIEVEEGRRLAEVVVKQLTGGDTITARFLFKEYFDFKPAFKLWLGANHKPVIRGTDHAIWRRIHLVPFTVTIPEEERDKKLLTKLKTELPGILAWAVRGCLAWQKAGELAVPEAVQAATAAYRSEMDKIPDFIKECCLLKAEAHVGATTLYEAYKAWSEDKITTQQAFGRRLTDLGTGLGFKNSKHTGRSIWYGIGLLSTEK